MLILFVVLVTGLPSSASWQDLKVKELLNPIYCIVLIGRAVLCCFGVLKYIVATRITCVEPGMSASLKFIAIEMVTLFTLEHLLFYCY